MSDFVGNVEGLVFTHDYIVANQEAASVRCDGMDNNLQQEYDLVPRATSSLPHWQCDHDRLTGGERPRDRLARC